MSDLQIATFRRPAGPLPHQMVNSDATGLPLLKDGGFAADLIRFPAGGCVRPHVHPGGHMLFVVGGSGELEFGGERVGLQNGVAYYVPGATPHAIYAETELTLISVSDDHRPVDAAERLEMV